MQHGSGCKSSASMNCDIGTYESYEYVYSMEIPETVNDKRNKEHSSKK